MSKQVFVTLLAFFLFLQAHNQNRYSVLIHEIMADPAPALLLPASEFIELYNPGSNPVDLSGWWLRDESGSSAPFPSVQLGSRSYLIICSAGAATSLAAFGDVLPVTRFPSLNNDGEWIAILDQQGRTIHTVSYSKTMYRNDVKAEGGWTLEMIDSNFPCAGFSNWMASHDPAGGTPGKPNAVAGMITDLEGPRCIQSWIETGNRVTLKFQEPLDSQQAVIPQNILFPDGTSPVQVECPAPLFDQIQFTLPHPLSPGEIMNLRISNIRDCAGLVVDPTRVIHIGAGMDPAAGDIIINEILFNPRSGGSDYIELYNRSGNIIEVSRLRMGNGNANDIHTITTSTRIIFPGDYLLLTPDTNSLIRDYWVKIPENLILVSGLPSFPDDKGLVQLLDRDGTILDEVRYEDNWHFPLMGNKEGVSLERIDPNGPSLDSHNWHSASGTSGHGTPGYKNSQFAQATDNSELAIIPPVFSPDNDGFEDFATIKYQVASPGMAAHVRIYDRSGRLIRYLVNNQMLGREGSWQWDGLDSGGNKIPAGIYIVLVQFISLDGKISTRKKTVIVD